MPVFRTMRIIARATCWLALLSGASALAAAPAEPVTTIGYEHWTVRCASAVCEASTAVSLPDAAGEPSIMTVLNLRRAPGADGYVLTLRLPLAVWLPAGVELADANREPVARLGFLLCVEQGCDAGTELTAPALSSWLAAGDRASLGYQRPDGRKVIVTFSLAGLADAVSSLAGPPPSP